MGDCGSRPIQNIDYEQFKIKTALNDKKFIPKIAIPCLAEYSDGLFKIIDNDDEQEAINVIETLDFQIERIKNIILRLYSESYSVESKLVIEIQKAKDIYTEADCFFTPDPFVQIVLDPISVVFKTLPGGPVEPN